MKRIVWLASYPKSGNTWMRAFLSNILHPRNGPADINNLDLRGSACDRALFDDVLSASASEMTSREIEDYRPEVYRRLNEFGKDRLFLKVHDAYSPISSGQPLFPSEVSFGALYLVRNPLDVVISLAHHRGRTVDATLRFMASEHATFAASAGQLHSQLPQRLLSWHSHVESWLGQNSIPVHVVRYEDMQTEPEQAFAAALRFLRIPFTPESLHEAMAQCSFDVLQRQEQEKGFRERPATASRFFRVGRSGQWREVLTTEQVSAMMQSHGTAMKRLGYEA